MKKQHISLILGAMAMGVEAMAQERPNVVYVFPDQYRNYAMEFWAQPDFAGQLNSASDPVHTPNINRFARESVVLSSAQSNCPLSSPHRGSLLTGMYPNRSGVPLNCNSSRPISSLRKDATCWSDVMSQAGYDCAYIGKLHTDFPTKNSPQNPGDYVEKQRPVWDAYTEPQNRHGFNYWYSYGTFDEHKNPHYWDTEGNRHEPHEWSPIYEAKKAIEYIQNKKGQRDGSKPFFLMVGMNPPHSPYRTLNDCMEEDYNLYRDVPMDKLLVRKNANRDMAKAESARYYFASVTGVDRAFGMILNALKEAGLDDNTVVVFSSDHGETMCSQNTDDPKNSPYTESMNVPFIIRYGSRLKPHVDNLLLSSPDIMPTMLGMAGLHDKIPAEIQGVDYSPLFYQPGSESVKRPDAALYIQNMDGNKDAQGNVIDYFPSARGVKTHQYTMAVYINRDNNRDHILLFDDQADPYQLNNIADTKEGKATVKKLYKRMGELLTEIDDPWISRGIYKRVAKQLK